MIRGASKRLAIIRILAVCVMAGFSAGCSPAEEPHGIWNRLWKVEVGPEYKPPQVSPPEAFRSQLHPSEAASIADLPWWKVFDDPALETLIATALAHNYSLQTAAARVEQARALVGVAASQFYPQVGYEGIAGREKAFVPFAQTGGNITFNVFSGVFNVVWELDVWGRIRRSTARPRARISMNRSTSAGA